MSISTHLPLASKINCLDRIGAGAVGQMCSFLNPLDLTRFECVAKRHITFTDNAWALHRRLHYYDFEWADCQKETHKNKYSYALGAAFYKYVSKTMHVTKDILSSQITFLKYEGLINRFPHFRCLLMTDIAKAALSPVRSYEIEREEILMEALKGKYAGEILLHAVLISKQTPVNSKAILEYLNRAVINGATCACLILFCLKITSAEIIADIEMMALNAARLKDFRALEILITSSPNQEDLHAKVKKWSEQGYLLGPLLVFLFTQMHDTYSNKDDLREFDEVHNQMMTLIHRGLDDYWDARRKINRASPDLIIQILLLLVTLSSNDSIIEFFDRYIAKSTIFYSLPYDLLVEIGNRKLIVKEYKEAEELLDRANHLPLKKDEKRKTDILISCLVQVKFLLGKNAEAIAILDQNFKYKDSSSLDFEKVRTIIKETIRLAIETGQDTEVEFLKTLLETPKLT